MSGIRMGIGAPSHVEGVEASDSGEGLAVGLETAARPAGEVAPRPAPGDDAGFAACLSCIAASLILSLAAFALVCGCVVLAPAMARRGDHPLYLELWAGCTGLSLVAVGARAAARRRAGPVLLAVGLVAILWLNVVRQCVTMGDLEAYVTAGRLIRTVDVYDWAGQRAALHGSRYYYSPFLAALLAGASSLPEGSAQGALFVAWTLANYWATVLLALLLIAVLHRVYRWPLRDACVASALALSVNTPLLRTLCYSQINVLVLDLLLGALLLWRRRPTAAACVLAVAALLKTSPLALIALPALERRYRAVGAFVGCAALCVGATVLDVGTRPWVSYLRAVPRIATWGYFRDNSLSSLLVNTAGALNRLTGLPARSACTAEAAWVHAASVILLLLLVAWVVWIGVRSGGYLPWSAGLVDRWTDGANLLPLALVLMTMASPLVWEHHWVWVLLPGLLILRATRAHGRWFAWALVGYALIFVVPTFDFYPLSYHRLAGLLCCLRALQGVCSGAALRSPAGAAQAASPSCPTEPTGPPAQCPSTSQCRKPMQ